MKKKTRRRTRPPMPPEMVRRNRVSVTLTDIERDRLRELAGFGGVSEMVARMIRHCLDRPDGEWRNENAA